MKTVVFFGDTARDKVDGPTPGTHMFVAGGGVYYGAVACSSCKVPDTKIVVVTKCSPKDYHLYSDFNKAGVTVDYLPSVESTQCEHAFPTGNPDERVTLAVTLSDPFTEQDVSKVPEADAICVNALYYGGIPEPLLVPLRKKTKFLVADAQGFVRHVENTVMVRHPWKDMHKWLPFIDVFKIDSLEGELLTGHKDLKDACKALHEAGANTILGTHKDGVILSYKNGLEFEALWGSWKMEGRTGRGDTVTAAFVAGTLKGMNNQEALDYAAKVCAAKMQRPGPYWG